MARHTSAVTVPQGWMGRSAGLSDRAIRLLREARWISLCFLALFLFLVLVSYDPRDPGWSHAVLARQTGNLGGRVGAWIAAAFVGVLVWGLIGWASRRYKRKDPNYVPKQNRYNLPMEIMYTIVPFIIIGVLFYYTVVTQNEVLAVVPLGGSVKVIGKGWKTAASGPTQKFLVVKMDRDGRA